MNPFSATWSAFRYLSEEAKRLGEALGAVADQIEARHEAIDDEPKEVPLLTNGNGHSRKLKASR